MAGAEGERGFDLDPDAILRNARAVVGAMHDEAAGLDWRQSGKALVHPIGRLDRAELQRGCGLGAGRRGDRVPYRLSLVGVAKMDRHLPAAATGLGKADGDIPNRKTLRNVIGDGMSRCEVGIQLRHQ